MLVTNRISPAKLGHILLLAVVLVWGTTFALVKAALADISPLLFNLLRMTVAFLVLAAFNLHTLRSITRKQLQLSALAGIFLGLGYQLQTAGLAHTSAAKSGFITGLVVVIVPMLSGFAALRPQGSHRPRWTGYAGAAIAFTGLVLLTAPGVSRSGKFAWAGAGEILTLGCAFAFAAHLLTLSHVSRRVPAGTLGTAQIGFAALLMLISLPAGGRLFLHPSTKLFSALAITAILATAAAFTIQSWAQQHLSSTQTALIFTLEPVFALLTSVIFLRERLSHQQLFGAGLILTGILVSELLSPTTALADASAAPASNPRDIYPD